MTRVNAKYKDRLFQKLFGENRANLLSLYNALNGTEYTNEDDLEIYTVEDVIYMKMKNDVSCMIDSYLSLYEHQSTFNPNMPFRGLMYFGKMYDKYRSQYKINVYSSKLQKLPTPQYYVFYNGDKDAPDKTLLKLSDAFMQPVKEGIYEWTAVMLNINKGHNDELLEKCRTLGEYAILVAKVKEFRAEGRTNEEAINAAVDWCIENMVMQEYLTAHRAEVLDMMLTEYNEEETMNMFREEGVDRVNALNRLLLSAKRFADMERAAYDKQYQNKLFAELLPTL